MDHNLTDGQLEISDVGEFPLEREFIPDNVQQRLRLYEEALLAKLKTHYLQEAQEPPTGNPIINYPEEGQRHRGSTQASPEVMSGLWKLKRFINVFLFLIIIFSFPSMDPPSRLSTCQETPRFPLLCPLLSSSSIFQGKTQLYILGHHCCVLT